MQFTDGQLGRVNAVAEEKTETTESDRLPNRTEEQDWTEQTMNLRREARSFSEKQSDEAVVLLGSRQSEK